MTKKKPFVHTPPRTKDSNTTVEKPIHCRVLIVCEGEKTERNYFLSFHMMQNSSSIVYEIKTEGGKIETTQVVNRALTLRKDAEKQGKAYDTVWAVFDKDDFSDGKFNDAIRTAEKEGIGCAWSNKSFELWLLYHFENRTNPVENKDLVKALEKYIGEYQKNLTEEYVRIIRGQSISTKNYKGDEQKAIRYAEKRARKILCDQPPQHINYAASNPCTTVYKLVRLLLGQDKAFNRELKAKMGEPLH